MKRSALLREPFIEEKGLKRVSIHVGEIYASRQPVVVQTLLGSCVSVCLMDRKEKLGGMNHILLPGKADLHQYDEAARYGVNAMELLINRLSRLGGRRGHLEAKMFGGATIIDGFEGAFNPGFRNGVFAREFLDLEGIPVTGEDVGGHNARRIFLRTDTGEVFVQRIPRQRTATVAVEEKEYWKRVKEELSKKGRVTLFEKGEKP